LGAFGDRMRREREMRKISLDEIATATKISTRMLKAIEDEQFDLLPGGIFNKGFIRAYAKFLGIDQEQAVADYNAAVGPEVVVDHLPQLAERAAERTRPHEPATISWTLIVVLVLILAFGYTGWTLYSRRKAERESRAIAAKNETAPLSTPAAVAAPVNAPSAGPTDSSKKNVAPPLSTPSSSKALIPATVSDAALKSSTAQVPATNQVDVVIRTTAESWISAVADGKTVFSETLPVSTEKHVVASRRVTLTIGNAAGVQITYNGAELPSLGEDGKVRTMVFTPDSFHFANPDEQ